MSKQALIDELKAEVLSWEGTSLGPGDFDSITFLYYGKEFGHVHAYGELDILFGKKITAALLQRHLVQKHVHVPLSSITYQLSGKESLPFAVSLLRFSKMLLYIRAHKNDAQAQEIFKTELKELPEVFSLIYAEL